MLTAVRVDRLEMEPQPQGQALPTRLEPLEVTTMETMVVTVGQVRMVELVVRVDS